MVGFLNGRVPKWKVPKWKVTNRRWKEGREGGAKGMEG